MVIHSETPLLEPLFLRVYVHTTAIIMMMKERNDIVDCPADTHFDNQPIRMHLNLKRLRI